MMGFDSAGNITNQNSSNFGVTWHSIIDASTKILTFIDAGGHNKYSKAMIHNFMNTNSDYALLVINIMTGVTEKTIEQFKITESLQIPSFLIVTHLDQANDDIVNDVMKQIRQMCKGHSELYPIMIRNMEDVVFLSKNIKEAVTSVFLVSSVNGKNLDLVRNFLNLLPVSHEVHLHNSNKHSLKGEFLIQNKFMKDKEKDQIILTGTVIKGCIKKHQLLYIGPDEAGIFRNVKVLNIQCYKIDVRMASCGQTCSICIQPGVFTKKWLENSNIRKGMVLVESKSPPQGVMEFVADFKLYDKEDKQVKTLPFNYEPVINSQSFRQCCNIVVDAELEEVKDTNFPRKRSGKDAYGKISEVNEETFDKN